MALQSTQIAARNRVLMGQDFNEVAAGIEEGSLTDARSHEIAAIVNTRNGVNCGIIFALRELLTLDAFAKEMQAAGISTEEITEALETATK